MKNERVLNLIINSFENKIGQEFTTQEIKKILKENIYPSDYCYNSYNKDSKDIYLFEKIKDGIFKYLGENYPYTGEIYWKPRRQKEEIVIGKWINGEREIYPENQLDNNYNEEIKMNTKNIILYGVPGVGKTHNINRLINLIEKNEDSEKEIFQKITQNSETNEVLINENLKSRVIFTTFHQSFAYEDFIEGFRPNNVGEIILRDGIFKTICDNAKKDRENNYYLIIDEINRGNISKIFGELITLIEESKRDKLEISLPYSQEKFIIPSNLFIIGTMNSTDKSIALIDVALRRRFTFLELKPNEDLIQNPDAKKFFMKLNELLEDDYKVGHSYFMGEKIDLEFVKEYKIKPLLKEYFYGNSEKLNEILNMVDDRKSK